VDFRTDVVLQALDDLGLTPGVLPVPVIKSTSVVVEVPATAVHRIDELDGDWSAE
jgi:hypothetical protein